MNLLTVKIASHTVDDERSSTVDQRGRQVNCYGTDRLLQPDMDLDPVIRIDATGSSGILLVCEHAGNAVPRKIGLGISAEAMTSHIAWDIGAARLTELLASKLGAAAYLQRYSRLVIDCNRPPGVPDSIPEVSDGVHVPANERLDATERNSRVADIFQPFDDALRTHLDGNPVKAAISVHSFTRTFGGFRRPWDIGLLFRQDTATSERLLAYLEAKYPELVVEANQPYRIDDASDWFVPRHAEPRRIPHSLIEVCNDRIATRNGQEKWADMLADALNHALAEAPE